MRHAGDSRWFLAVTAALMAGLVVGTMVAMNARLQSALSPTAEPAGTPAVPAIPTRSAPVLHSTPYCGRPASHL